MSKYFKNIALLIVLACALFVLASCGGDAANDVPVSDIAQSVDTAIGNEGDMIAVDETYISGSMKMDVSNFEEYTVKINGYGVNIDEYGVFKGADKEQTEKIADAVKAYLDMRMTEYMPEEFPKLENAEYRTVGNYVMYAILSDENKASAFSAFEESLK
jgi:hypothetical protein